MKACVLGFAILAGVGLAACDEAKTRHPPPDPMALAPSETVQPTAASASEVSSPPHAVH